MKYHLTLYIMTLLVMGIFDALWLGLVAKDFYQSRIGAQFVFNHVPAVLFYLMYVGGVLLFVSGGTPADWKEVAMYGALLGLLAFATYDLTNLATLRNWSLQMSLVDIVWGIFNTSTSATLGWLATRFILR